ncbi:MAG: DNA repair protein RecN [Oscillospiraceae bacterium]|nr:DNA repair protein RecN [Oscillospiraceae bacterium]
MLSELYIKNLAVIEEANIPFTDSFNVFTGETGAGKSILVNGISAVLGQRTNKDIVRAGCEKAIITATFTGISDNVKKKLTELGVDSEEDDRLLLTREINSDGGSSARINMRTATASALREIGECLVNIHGQHDNQQLLSPENHLFILDSFGELEGLRNDYTDSFRKLQSISRELKKMAVEYRDSMQREQSLKAAADEIDALALTENEDIEVETEYRIAQNSESIKESLSAAAVMMDGDEDGELEGAIELIRKCIKALYAVSENYGGIKSLCERLDSVSVELDDISSEISHENERIDIDGERYGYLTERLNSINAIKKKYGLELSDVLAYGKSARRELELINDSTSELERLSAERERLLEVVSEKAKTLSLARERAAERFSEQVEEELKFLDMPDVKLSVKVEKGKLTVSGMDSVEIFISTNKGEGMKPLYRIASGGELSRIMLALKNVTAEKDDIETLIFDEIDTGVSGRAAQKIGIKLKQVSRHRQVICVTHLSQLAVMADNHLLIEKSSDGSRTFTHVKRLDFTERKYEIARIMCGSDITETALKNAEELLRGGVSAQLPSSADS